MKVSPRGRIEEDRREEGVGKLVFEYLLPVNHKGSRTSKAEGKTEEQVQESKNKINRLANRQI